MRERHGCDPAGESRRCLALILTRMAVAEEVDGGLDQQLLAKCKTLCLYDSSACHRLRVFCRHE